MTEQACPLPVRECGVRGGCGAAGTSQKGVVTVVVVMVVVAESDLADPHAGTEFRQHDAGLLSELTDRGLRERLARVDAAAG